MGEALRCVGFVVALVVCSAGCVDLADVESQECGNLVLEADEDCDGTSAFGDDTACGAPDTQNECAYVCDPAESTICPEGWGCGSDLRCRRHSGEFVAAGNSPYRFDVDDFAIGDVDGDGHLDLIGQDLGDLKVRFGDEDGDFATEYVKSSGIVRGNVAFGQFSDDNRTDVVLPLVEGISVFLGSSDETLEPVLFSPFSLDEVFGPEDFLRILPVESIPEPISSPTELILIVDAYTEAGIYEGSLMTFFGDDSPPIGLPGSHRAEDLVGRVPIANVDSDPIGRNEFALAFGGAASVWVYTSVNGLGALPLALQVMHVIPLGTRRVRDGAHFGDFDGDGDLDVIISVDDNGNEEVMVSLNQGGGVFGLPAIQPIFQRGFGSPFPLAVGALDSDAHADYAYPEAIYLSGRMDSQIGTPDVLLGVAQTQGAFWSEAVFGDFNGDGMTDVAASFIEEDGVDLFINSATLFLNRFRVGTTDNPNNLRVGDFDGDTIGDVAFLQRSPGAAGDTVHVIFGGTDGPSTDAVSMGQLGSVETFEAIIGQTFLIDGISDLFVVSRSGPDGLSRNIALLQGSSAQHLSSPFTLVAGVEDNEPDIPFQVFTGQFTNDSVRDVVAIADVVGNASSSDRKFRLWALPGASGDGSIKTELVTFLDIAGQDFEAECAVWTSGDLDGDGIDEIVGVDGSSSCPNRNFARQPRLFIGANAGAGTGVFNSSIRDVGGSLRGVEELSLIDLDNDGDLDLLARMVGDPATIDVVDFTIDNGGLMVVWNRDGVLNPDDFATVEITNGAVLVGAAAAVTKVANVPTLLAVTIDGVYLAELASGAESYGNPTLTNLGGGTGRIQVGDLNKDGLDDVAYVVNREMQVMLGKAAPPLGAEQ